MYNLLVNTQTEIIKSKHYKYLLALNIILVSTKNYTEIIIKDNKKNNPKDYNLLYCMKHLIVNV